MLLTHGRDVVSLTKKLPFSKMKKLIIMSQEISTAAEELQANSNSGKEMLKKSLESGIAKISFSKHAVFNGTLHQSISSLHEWRNGRGLILNSDCNFMNNRWINEIINEDGMKDLLCKLHELVHCIRTLPFISVFLLNGKSSGIGTDLFLSTDFRLLTPRSELNFDHLKFGLPPLAGGVELLKNVTGERECLRLLFLREKLSAEAAVDLGLADQVLSRSAEGDGGGGGVGGGWSTDEQVKSAENWLLDLLGRTNEDASIVQAVKRILVSTRDGSGARSRKLDVESREICSCLHGQPHLTAMGLCSEPSLAHLPPPTHHHPPHFMATDYAKDDSIL